MKIWENIMIRRYKILLALTVLVVGVVAFSLAKTNASDVDNWRSAVFKDVKRVYIEVKYNNSLDKGVDIPDPLKKEAIENKLIEMYSARFDLEKCLHGSDYGLQRTSYKFSCHDQPVILVRNTGVPVEEKQLIEKERRLAGSLNVTFMITIRDSSPNYDDPALSDGLVGYYIKQERPKDNMYDSSFVEIYPVTQSEKSINKRITKYISRRIKH